MPPPNPNTTVVTRAGGRRVASRGTDKKKEREKRLKKEEKERKQKEKRRNRQIKGNHVRDVLVKLGIATVVTAAVVAGAVLYLKNTSRSLPKPHEMMEALVASVVLYRLELLAAVASGLAAMAAYYGYKRLDAYRVKRRHRLEHERMQKTLEAERERRKQERKRLQAQREQELTEHWRQQAGFVEEMHQQEMEREIRRQIEEEERLEHEQEEREIAAQLAALTQRHKEEAMMAKLTATAKPTQGSWRHTYVQADEESEGEDDDEESEAESEGEEDGQSEEDVEVALEPQRRGTEIELQTSLFHNIASLQLTSIKLQLACTKCSTRLDAELSGLYSSQSYCYRRCSRCKNIVRCSLRPYLVHENSTVAGSLELESLAVADIMTCRLRGVCLGCNGSATFHKPVKRGVRCEATCDQCAMKLAITVGGYSFKVYDETGAEVEAGGSGAGVAGGGAGSRAARRSDSGNKKTNSRQQQQQLHLVVGKPLMDLGACKHFPKSLRWLRFPCCHKAFPCPVCHEMDGCEGAVDGTRANRMICGKCSLEQNFSNKPCDGCGFGMTGSKATAHWQGGAGGRDTSQLSGKDKRKNKGVSKSGVKKTHSKKSQRVGAAGKRSRET